jgi:hypothetical protein
MTISWVGYPNPGSPISPAIAQHFVQRRLAEASRREILGTLRKRQQIIRLDAVRFGFDVFVTAMSSDNDLHYPASSSYLEMLTTLDLGNARGLRDLEASA